MTKEADCRVLIHSDTERERVWGIDMGPGPGGFGRKVELRNSSFTGSPEWGDVIHAVPIVEADGYHEPLSFHLDSGQILKRYKG